MRKPGIPADNVFFGERIGTRCRFRLEALRGRFCETQLGVALAIRRYSIELGLERNYRQVLGLKTKVRCAEGRSKPPKLGHY